MRTELTTFAPAPFDCDRTCRTHETRDYCRFNPLFALIGATPTVNSHTVKIKTQLDDPRALESAVKALGWKWIGQGRHDLYGGQSENGHGFKIPNWSYPCILTDAGTLAYDNFNGSWGDINDLEALKTAYLTTRVETAAEALGWQHERTDTGIRVYHPESGVIDVSHTGVCETTGFVGGNCHSAREALGLKPDGEATNKTEIDHLPAVVQQGT